ncbi:MAG: Lrp/AsnC ligand binding domain-containing protein [Candidatus Bathyarchaeia archaeon]|jgi:DNA-binding Lrp family transcriptional regulator
MTKKSHDPKPHAFIMISCHPGSNSGNLDTLRKMPEVIEAHAVYGIYDEMVRVKTETMADFRELNTRIRRLPNIRSTITMFIE